jgi:hypothetical protein
MILNTLNHSFFRELAETGFNLTNELLEIAQ